MSQRLRVLLVEDDTADAEMIVRALKRAGYDPKWKRVDTEEAFLASLDTDLDVILSDHAMPQFSGPRALELLAQSGLNIPFLTISGTIGEDVAVESMKSGAVDYLLKDRLSRLGQAVQQCLTQRQLRLERQKTEDALRESEERLKLALAASHMGVWEWDVRTEALYLSPENLELLGLQTFEGTVQAFQQMVHPDDMEGVAASHKTALADRTMCRIEFRLFRPDGMGLWVALMGRGKYDEAGNPLRMVGTSQDITQRKEAEAQIAEQAALLDKAKDAIIVRDLNHKVLFWSMGAERLYGWTAEEMTGRDVTTVLYRVGASMTEPRKLVVERGEWAGGLRQVTKDGREVEVDSHWTLVRDDLGRPKSILSINTDVTERKQLEAQFFRAQRLESIGTLAGGIAHDLNNVLTPIMMSIDLLRLRTTDPVGQTTLNTIAASAKRGAAMVSQVLSFARGVECDRRNLGIKPLIDDLVAISAESFPKNIQFKSFCDPQLWNVLGDATQIHQVLLNLCINARDAMPEGGWLAIKANNFVLDDHYAAMMSDAKPGPYVVIQVADTGAGMRPEVIDRIFDPFFTTKELGQGTGLGLSTSLAIVKSHGGFIRVDSQPGKGSEFKIYLPAEMEVAEDEAIENGQTPLHGNGELILVVDDEVFVRNVMQQTLENFGYQVLVATDGAEAVALYAERPEVAVVVMDMMMPVMDGPTTIQVLASMAVNLPIIAASGLADTGTTAAVAALGVKHFLSKPYTGATLLRLLHRILRPDE
ncbi:MAG: multi-sensor hybrid histidine kinase [Verrucomicrobiaceae bacterium]|nr:multi-sensor hybrid histidine kinase [Verrucomicrobiaceae bacterium]